MDAFHSCVLSIMERTLELVNGHGQPIRVHCFIDGPDGAPWVVLAHALAGNAGQWLAVAEALASKFRLLRYDLRGHGQSVAPVGEWSFSDLLADLHALLDALAIGHAHFAGISLGGMLGQYFALEARERLGKLVLLSTTSFVPPESAPLWNERIALAQGAGMQAHVAPTLARWFTPDYAARHPEVLSAIGQTIAATSVAGYCGCIAALRRHDTRARLADIAAPTLVLAGADDPASPASAGEAIATAIPGARFVLLQPASHLLNVERAETCAPLIADFLR